MARFNGTLLEPGTQRTNSFRREQLPSSLSRPGGSGSFGGPGVAGDMARLNLPGGALLEFNLNNLTLADFRAMRQHYQLSMNLNVLAVSLHQITWNITGGTQRARDFISDNLNDVWTELILGATQAYWAGYSPMVLDFENSLPDRRVYLSKVKDLIPERSGVNWREVERNTNANESAGNRPRKNYIYDGIKQVGVEGHIQPESTLWYPVMMENGNMTGRKLLKAAFMPWFFSQLMNMYQNRYFERFGEPIIIGRAPFDQVVEDQNGEQVTGKQVMDRVVGSLKNHTSAILPSDRTMDGNGDKNDYEYTVDFLDTQMRGADFDRVITHYDEAMSLAMFTPILLFRTADVGSYSLGQAHENIFYHMVNMLVEDFARYINKYLLPRMVAYNFSEEMARDMRFEHRKLGVDRQETLRAIAQAMVNGESAMPNLAEFGQAMGMEWEAVQKVEEEGPGAAQTPQNAATNQVAQLSAQVGDRVLGQLRNASDSGTNMKPEIQLGFSKLMTEALVKSGATESTARNLVAESYSNVSKWYEETSVTDPEELAIGIRHRLAEELTGHVHAA